MSTSKIKGAIFDIDGTLIDSMPIWVTVADRYLESQGKQAEPDIADKVFSLTMDQSAAYMQSHYGVDRTIDEIKQGFIDVVTDFYRNEVTLKEGAKEFLDELKKRDIPMVLATVGDANLASYALNRLGILDYFTDLLTAIDFGTDKTEPLIYLKAAEKIGCKPSETAVFEDVVHALDTASKADFITVAVEDKASLKDRKKIEAVSDFYIKTYHDFRINPGFTIFD